MNVRVQSQISAFREQSCLEKLDVPLRVALVRKETYFHVPVLMPGDFG